jgi:hypothetical protein
MKNYNDPHPHLHIIKHIYVNAKRCKSLYNKNFNKHTEVKNTKNTNHTHQKMMKCGNKMENVTTQRHIKIVWQEL